MRAHRWTLAALALIAALPAGAQTLDRYLGRRITEVHLVLDGRETQSADVSRVLVTKAGSVLTTSAVRESIIHLMALARFEDVQVEAEEIPGGVRLIYDLTPLHPVKVIEFSGDLGLPARVLHDAVVERYTASPPVTRAAEIARMLEGLLHDRGYLKAAVTPAPEVLRRADKTTLVFQVQAGPQVKVGDVEVVGAPEGDAAAVAARLGLQRGSSFDRLALDDAVAAYAASLRAGGYLEARVADPEVGYSRDRERVDVTIRVNRGPRVRIEFRGDPLPETRRDEVTALRSQGALDEDLLENEQRAVENDLHALGYRDATAAFVSAPAGAGEHLIVYTVRRGPQYRVGKVAVTGNQHVPLAEILSVVRVSAGPWFVAARVPADEAAITDLYRQQGYRNATVTAATTTVGDPQPLVDVRYAVTEGVRTVIAGPPVFQGNAAIGTTALQAAVASHAEGPYYQPRVESDRDAVLAVYLNQGYQQATVDVPEAFSADGTIFELRFLIHEGPQFVIDHIVVAGNVHTSAAAIERELGLRPGMPLSTLALATAQRRLSTLGLFRRVEVTDLSQGTDNRRDVLVVVQEGPVNTIGYGGGLEGSELTKVDAEGRPSNVFDLAPRGFVEFSRRNLWGTKGSINLFARGAIRSSDEYNTGTGTAVTSLQSTGSGFREYRLLVTYREPKFMDLPIDLEVSASADQAIRPTFDFNRLQLYVQGSHRLRHRLSVAGRYAFGRTRLFNELIAPDEQLDVDKVFPRVRLSSFSASLVRNTRNDDLDPTRGTLFTVDGTLAARAIGSEVGFAKTLVQAFVYQQLPILSRPVLAAGARLGLATGFPQLVPDPNGSGQLVSLPQDLPASERFFAGGDTTVRGFPLDGLGAVNTLDQYGEANGGNGLVIFNTELRVPLFKVKGYSVGGATFIDTGNVFALVSQMSLGDLRSGAGVGLRMQLPFGPLRLDFAWKLNPQQLADGTLENRFAWYITLGHPF
jgi:outer membrane protein assembly factor BamA